MLYFQIDATVQLIIEADDEFDAKQAAQESLEEFCTEVTVTKVTEY